MITYAASFAPAAAAASSTCSIVLSLSAGMSAATITPQGTLLSFRRRTTSSRLCALAEHFEDAARDLVLALDRLVAIGVGAEGDRARPVARLRQLCSQQLRGVGSCEELRFEIEPGRELQIRVARARVAVVADHAIGDEVLGLGRDVKEPHRLSERFDRDDAELGRALHCLAADIAL